MLKVAGSGSGFKRSPESMLPSLVKNSKATYVYDNKADQLVYVANSHSELSREIGLSLGTLSRILREESLYLNRFILSSKLLNENDSLAEIMNPEEFFKLVSEAREDWKKALKDHMNNIRKAAQDKLSKKVELTNTKTGLVLILNSLNETARYIQTLDPEYSKVKAGALISNIKKGFSI